ncbi:hypothetical protein L596_008932 [Steinernema carpocapsae]|uniref:Uncharacterized protein n=1 Tax=Steinernema carpocapsae TaxID=34508 RepID=A0A4U5PDY7_STECR|nr:hypothetical protein L596_008932 [Steinernema carpocapsae]
MLASITLTLLLGVVYALPTALPLHPSTDICDCDFLGPKVHTEANKIGQFLISLIYNTEGYEGCSQEENVGLARSFLYKLFKVISKLLNLAEAILPSENPFHFTCEPQKKLKKEFDEQLTTLVKGFGQSERCGCPAKRPLDQLLDLSDTLLSTINVKQWLTQTKALFGQ